MSLAAGARLGPYEIVSQLGSGGMGDVYKARDTRLGRFVAIKTLRPELAGSGEARDRFEREARTISKLSHPHVCAIHDVGQADGVLFLVMELLDGETLSQRLARAPLSIADLLRDAMHIADALAAAHRQGIVHRDLKPGNVMITGSGVKLVDFGLSKAIEPARTAGNAGNSVAPDLTAVTELTGKGVWLGTAPYMAPEQIQGKPADTRSDVFALGVVLYEMATRRRTFPGQTLPEIAAAILHREPPSPSSIRTDLPPAFDRLVRDCLVKDPDRRWQSAHDVALQLATIQESIDERARLPHARQASGYSVSTWLAWGIAAVAIASAVAVRWQQPRAGQAVAPVRTELHILPPPNGSFLLSFETVSFALSPDGSTLAYVGADAESPRRIWIRPLASIDARPVAGTTNAGSVFWSPDSKSIGFFADGSLKRLDLTSGAAATVCSVPRSIGMTATWSPTGDILFASIEGDAIYRVNASGGEPVVDIKPDRSRNEIRTAFPSLLPDGRRYLYLTRLLDNTGWLMLGEVGKSDVSHKRVLQVESNAAYVNGVLVFARGGGLWGQRFDPATVTLSGEALPLAKSVRFLLATGLATFSASSHGTIVYQSGSDRSRVAWLDRTGRESAAIDAPGNYLDLRLARQGPPGIALASRTLPTTGAYDVWALDLNRGTETRLTPDDVATEINAMLTDANTLVFSAARGGPPRLVRRNLATGTEESMMPPSRRLQTADDITPDGKLLAYEERTDAGNYNLWTVPLAGGAATLLRKASSNDLGLRFSPDGRYYTYMSNESGRYDVYVSPVAGGSKTAVSNGGGGPARWSADGREMFYVTTDRRLVSVSVRTTPTLELGTPTTLFALGGKAWVDFDVSPDGKRFLAVIPEVTGNEQPLTALVNWTAP